MTQRSTYLEDGDWAVIEGTDVAIRNASGAAVQRPIIETGLSGALTGKDGHPHFMLKEIFEQPLK